ncbi:MAG TPA: hypothetical protein VIK01_19835 [Polyangiaceae bacterium]
MGRLIGLGLRGARRWAITLGSLAAALGASACSPATDSKTSPGAAGSAAITAGNGGAAGSAVGAAGSGGNQAAGGAGTAGSTGTAGASPFGGDTEVDACITYLQAACQRRSECMQSDPSSCFASSSGCPDMYFSEGSLRTVAGTKACAETYKTFPCAQLLAGDIPSCVTAGTRAAGQSCSFPSQCSSLSCTIDNGSKCGLCAIAGPAGADCSVAGVVCNDGLRCNAAQVCEVIPPSTRYTAKEGQPCTIADGCADTSLFCQTNAATPVCTKYPTLGMSCADSGTCFGESYCQNGQTCVALPAIGEPCAGVAGTSGSGLCAKNATCAATGMCVAKSSIGAPCTSNDQCSIDLSCVCSDTTCTSPVCTQLRYSGQSCGTPGLSCHPSFTCTNGVCQPITLHGVFAACGSQ